MAPLWDPLRLLCYLECLLQIMKQERGGLFAGAFAKLFAYNVCYFGCSGVGRRCYEFRTQSQDYLGFKYKKDLEVIMQNQLRIFYSV